MFKTLYGKLAVVLLGLFLLLGIFFLLSVPFTTKLYLQEVQQTLNRSLAEQLVSEKILIENGRVNRGALEEIFHTLMVINPSIEVYLLDRDGTILAFSAPSEKVKHRKVSLEPLARFLGNADPLPIVGDDPRDLRRSKVFSAAPIPAAGPPEGYLYVILGGEAYDSVLRIFQGSYILRLSAWITAGGILLALAAGLFLFRRLTRRVRKLSSAMEVFAKSDFSDPPALPLKERGGDEIDLLETTFRKMADRILLQLATLQKSDALRREWVAGISHDLRTPLTSLQGYLETLLMKEGTLTREEEKAFLELAVRHGERLHRLISQLFELAKLDSGDFQPHFETFSLGELVQDIAQKFQLAVDKKRVRLQTQFRADLPFVRGDIGLMERVFENLIENALRHTPPEGTITVSLASQNEEMNVQVADTGSGIPKEDIPFIFDRFYRGKTDRPEGDGSTGLGLAVTRRILELHGAAIGVESALGRGTVFSFSLPA